MEASEEALSEPELTVDWKSLRISFKLPVSVFFAEKS
jgi:hypothetical protein